MFPSTISTFNIVSASDRLNSPSHSALHNSVSSVLTQVQTVIGTDTASALGTIIGDLRNPASGGGGHVQSANKGGTGQTTYTKGDLLVATGPSVFAKLAVGGDGQALVADSSVAAGVKWGSGGTRVYSNASIITVVTGSEGSIISTTIPGSTLGTNGTIVSKVFWRIDNILGGVGSIITKAHLGGNMVASVILQSPTTINRSVFGSFQHTIVENNADSQRHFLTTDILTTNPILQFPSSILASSSMVAFTTSSVTSSANQSYGMTVYLTNHATSEKQRLDAEASYVQKIV